MGRVFRKLVNKLNPGRFLRRIRIYIDRDFFDILHGTDTALAIPKSELFEGYAFNDIEHMNYYVGGLTSRIKSALHALLRIDDSVLNCTFFDLGSGKGKVLILAERIGFSMIIGVEISPELNNVCRNNLKKVNSRKVDIIECDAATIKIPSGCSVFYIYNSFERPLLEKVLNNIEQSFENEPRKGYLVYIDPKSLIDKNKFQLDEERYSLVYEDNNALNPYHIYRIRQKIDANGR